MELSAETFQRKKLVRHENLLWLLAAQAVVIFPLLFTLPLWLGAVWFIALVWRLQIHTRKRHFPSSFIKFILCSLCIVGLLMAYKGAYSMEMMVGFLVLTFILKLLELQTRKDALLLIYIGFVGLATQFLFTQSILGALYALFASIVLITALYSLYLTRSIPAFRKLKQGATFILLAIPLMMVLFLVLPKLGPLWRTAALQTQAHTGFSDSMSPGDISSLVQSQGTAFRVNFLGSIPPKTKDMYWRGLVLEDFDGRGWHLNKNWDRSKKGVDNSGHASTALNYEIILEPHNYQWLFSLVQAVSIESGKIRSRITEDDLIATRVPVNKDLQYTVRSYPREGVTSKELPMYKRQQLLMLPSGYNPQTIALAKRWVEEGQSPRAIIQSAWALYNQSFSYTLQPPLLGENSVDEFLFQSQQGFCEHFASSFAVLMRAANIPARIVVGYHGGIYNQLDDYWIIKQSDAHAWVEVWLDDQGWIRMDPTSSVAPDRIEQGLENSLGSADRQLLSGGFFNTPEWLTDLRYRIDAANYMWSRWVLNYDADKQSQLFKELLGGKEWWRLLLAFTTLIVFLASLYIFCVLKPQRRKKTPLQRALSKFDKTCLKWGINRYKNETIAVFTVRLASANPELKLSCSSLSELSQRVLYGNDREAERQLIDALVTFPDIKK